MGTTFPVLYRGRVISNDAWRAAFIFLNGVGPLIAVVAWLIGLGLHGLGRSTAGALQVTVFGFGMVMGSTITTAIGITQQQPTIQAVVNAMVAVAFPLVFVVGLAMFGRRRVAGLLLAGAALPWTAYWTLYVIDIALGAPWEPLFTGAMLLAGLGPLLIGVAIAANGDAVYAPDPTAPVGRPGSRRPGNLGKRLVDQSRYGVIGPSLVLAFAAATIATLAIPSLLIGQLLIAMAAAIIGTEVELRWIPPAVRPAIEAYHWVGRSEIVRFRQGTGDKVPTSMAGFRAWVARTPETDATRPYRVEVLTVLGDFDQARAELDRLPETTPWETFKRAIVAQELWWRQGAPADLPTIARLASEVGPDADPDREAAEGNVAWWSGQVALAAMDASWRAPLAAFRERLGPAAAGLHATAMRARTLLLALIPAAIIVLLNALPR